MDNTKVEQKLAEAVSLIKEASVQFVEAGLELDFEITIKAQRPICISNFVTNPGENTSPLK